jgi:hypothetical protein
MSKDKPTEIPITEIPEDELSDRQRIRDRRILLGLALGGIILLAILAVVLSEPLAGLFASPTTAPPTSAPSPAPPTPTSIIHRGPIIVRAIRSEAKLETYRLTMVNDVEVIRPSGPANICTERIVYIGYYDVTAGVDLAKIGDGDVVVVDTNGQMTVTITLPPAEIVDVTLDTGASHLAVQETPKWIPGCETQVAEMTLEAQQKIKEYALETALKEGILQRAQEHAGFVLQRLLYDLGYPHVVIRYGTAP